MKKLFTFLLALIASVGIASAQSGTCGDNLTWELNTETGDLTISGTGAMADYPSASKTPWYGHRSAITTILINDGVTSIGNEAFNGCSALTSVTIPNSVTSIGYRAFYNCTSLTSVTIPNSVTSIGDQAFNGCSALTSITIPNSVTSIGNRAFYNCSALTSITIPNSVTSIGYEAFDGCSSLTSPVYNAHCFAYMPPSYSGAYAIPEGIKQIAGGAFSRCSSLTSVTIGNSVTSIGSRAFYNCTSLTSVTIPNSVTSIGEYAFYNVSNIVYHGTATGSPWGAKSVNGYVENNLVYADETKKILLACFTSAQGEIIIPNTVISIGNSAFDGCSSLTSVTIPNSVTSIGRSAFSYCSSLTSVTIGNSVTSIESSAFSYCSSLTSVTIGNSVTSIGYAAFCGCSSLTSITIPNSVTSIENFAFDGCTSLTSITIPNSVTSIGDAAFSGCSSVTSVTIGNSVTSIGDQAFRGCSSLTSVTIGNSVTSIGSSAFSYCSSLTSVTIPNSVTSIGESAFNGCSSLTSVTIGNSVTSIENFAFFGCTSLTSVTFEGSTPPSTDRDVFYNTNNCPIYVPCGTKDAYVTALNENNTIDESRVIEKTFIASGTCGAQGDNLTWELSCDSILTISGTGEMVDWNYGEQNYAPWHDYSNFVVTVILPDGLTHIGHSAFFGCSQLQNINIPNTVMSVGEYALTKSSNPLLPIINGIRYADTYLVAPINDNLSSYVIEEGTKWIGTHAFYTVAISSITIPNSVIGIGSRSFIYTDLTEITIPNSVETIGNAAFYDCNHLKDVIIGSGVKWIGYSAFSDCNSLSSITCKAVIPPVLEEARVFRYTSKTIPLYVPAESIDAYKAAEEWKEFINILPIEEDPAQCLIASGYCGADSTNLTWELSCDSVLTISGTGATANYIYSTMPWYEYRSSIQSVIITDGVTSIGYMAFYNCSSLTSVTIPNSVTSIGGSAFENCTSLTSINVDSNNPNYSSVDGVLFNKDITKLIQYPIGNIRSEYTIPNSVTSIEQDAFLGCSSLTSVTIPNSVTSIGISAFRDCTSLTSITIPNSVTSIEDRTFQGCSSLTSVTIPNSVTSIGISAFRDCTSLTSITIPNSVTSIEDWAFFDCSSLTSVTIPNSVTSVGMQAFLYCDSLNAVYITDIAAWCGIDFYDSKSNPLYSAHNLYINGELATDLIIPNSVTTVTQYVFESCYSLTSVTIPNSVTSIGKCAFRDCNSLNAVYITDLTAWCGIYFQDSKASPLFYAHNLYLNGKLIEDLVIPNNTTNIGRQTFCYCTSLTSVTIPNSVTTIGRSAFNRCSSLTSVTFEGLGLLSIDSLVFNNTNNFPIYVPCGTKEAYVTALNENNTIDESRVIEKLPYTYSVLTSDSTLGSVTITQEPTCTEPVIFRADAAEGYQFTQWSDGNTDNPRSLILTQDTILKALFEQIVIEQDTIIVADSTGISDIIPDGQDTIPYVEVQPDGEITIDITDVRIGVITIVTIGTESGQVHPGFGGNYDELENTRVVMEYVLNPFGQTASPDKWYAFAVPFEVDIETGITRKYGNKSHVPGKDFMILEYDSELRSKTGKGWVEKKSGSLTPGHIYMLGIEGNCNRWLFEKERGTAIVGDKEKDLQHYAHGNSKNDGWQGLGNTTLEYVDMSFSIDDILYILVYDNQHSRYITYHIDELVLAVGQPFFVQTTQEGTSVVFEHNNGKGKGNGNGKKNMPIYAPSYDVQPTLPRVRFTIENENINATPDRLYITLHDDNLSGSYIIGRDLMRMDKGSKQVPNFWCPMADGTQLSAHGVTMPTTYTTIPLGIFTPAKGEYTINAHMQDMDDYIVEIYYQNVCLGTFMHDMPLTLDLTAGTSYDYSIRISRRVSTDLNPAEDTQCDKDNKWYDVLGRPLPQDAHGIFIRKGEKIIK